LLAPILHREYLLDWMNIKNPPSKSKVAAEALKVTSPDEKMRGSDGTPPWRFQGGRFLSPLFD
jgi:hypothetical protein